ncbi:hypothetical protein Ndes2526B_g01505 [Nannochloris sp. 'desiccata']|nr:putative Formyltetrahydrofolate deformylase [Chlorella desiccata (nom. nud.)]
MQRATCAQHIGTIGPQIRLPLVQQHLRKTQVPLQCRNSRVATGAAASSNGNGSAAGGSGVANTPFTKATTSADTKPAEKSLKTSTPKEESIPKSSIYVANLLVRCPDAKGVVASLSQLLYGMNCNIVTSDQFSDLDENHFYQRITLDYSELLVGPGNTAVLEHGIKEVAQRYDMEWKIAYRTKKKRVALLVSKMDHCLYDLLIRHESGELDCDIPVVISNWNDLAPVAAKFDIPFRHLPVNTKEPGSKEAQEAALEALIEELEIEVIVLARYMQIFSPSFADKHWKKTINVHHSFLPAFHGAKPYHRAHERGVKLIGATAHYATSDLDCGPIIDQDVTRVTHRDSIADMIRKGRDLERLVLSRALRWHLNDRVVVTGNEGKTVVFED